MANLEMLSGQVLRDATGAPYLGAKAYYWSDSGATTPLATYSDAGLTTPNTAPVVSDGTTGAFGAIYLSARRYWRTLTTSAGVSLPQFNLGPIDANMTLVTSAAAPSPTYPLLWWYDTTTGNLKRRNAADNAWIDFGGIDSILNAASVTEQLAGTSAAKSSTPDSVAGIWQRGPSITPSADTVSLPASGGGVFNIQAGNFSAISSAQGGRVLIFEFAGASTITHNSSSMDLPGGANITTAAGDRAAFVNLAAADASGSNWRMLWMERDDGSWPFAVATQAQQETGTNLTFPVTPGRQHFHDSALKAWIAFNGAGTPTATDVYNFATGSSGITDNGVGDYTCTFTTALSTAAGYAAVGMSNSAAAGNVSSAQMCARGPNAGLVLAASIRVDNGNANTGAAVDEEYIALQFAGDI